MVCIFCWWFVDFVDSQVSKLTCESGKTLDLEKTKLKLSGVHFKNQKVSCSMNSSETCLHASLGMPNAFQLIYKRKKKWSTCTTQKLLLAVPLRMQTGISTLTCENKLFNILSTIMPKNKSNHIGLFIPMAKSSSLSMPTSEHLAFLRQEHRVELTQDHLQREREKKRFKTQNSDFSSIAFSFITICTPISDNIMLSNR